MKLCKRCKVHKDLSEFHARKRSIDGKQYHCKQCALELSCQVYSNDPVKSKAISKQWKATNPNRTKDFHLRKYGISADQYDCMLKAQNDSCAICMRHKSEFKRSLAVDHDHVTNKVRGLLCSSCNAAIGLLKENIDTLISAEKYLMSYKGIQNG